MKRKKKVKHFSVHIPYFPKKLPTTRKINQAPFEDKLFSPVSPNQQLFPVELKMITPNHNDGHTLYTLSGVTNS